MVEPEAGTLSDISCYNIFMKKNVLLSILTVFACMSTLAWANGIRGYYGGRSKSPKVSYISPENDSIVDLTGKKNLTFRWKPTPIPVGDRRNYKFTLYKEFEYGSIFKQVLDEEAYFVDVPSDILENGKLYTWQVKQRAEIGGDWGDDHRWSFTVQKSDSFKDKSFPTKEDEKQLKGMQDELDRMNDETWKEKQDDLGR